MSDGGQGGSLGIRRKRPVNVEDGHLGILAVKRHCRCDGDWRMDCCMIVEGGGSLTCGGGSGGGGGGSLVVQWSSSLLLQTSHIPFMDAFIIPRCMRSMHNFLCS